MIVKQTPGFDFPPIVQLEFVTGVSSRKRDLKVMTVLKTQSQDKDKDKV